MRNINRDAGTNTSSLYPVSIFRNRVMVASIYMYFHCIHIQSSHGQTIWFVDLYPTQVVECR